ncbi:MAG TPA: AAA domain-containing protein, partial [Actinomycetales bacterium]
MKGPPGTGKSQTIANLIAALSAAGKRTLFVAEKRAAIDAVLQRLVAVGLDDLVLDLHDGGVGRRRVARELATTLDRAGRVARPDHDDLEATLVDRRDRLKAHARALHEVRRPWGVTAYAAQSALADLTARRPAPRSRVRVRGEALERLDAAELGRLREELREAASLGALRAGPDEDPWFGARLETAAEAEQALTAVTELNQQSLPLARRRMEALLTELGMPPATSLASWGRTLALVGAVRQTLEIFSPDVFDSWLAEAVAATAGSRWRQEHDVSMGWLHRGRLRRQARAHLRPGTPPRDLHAALAAADAQRTQWQQAAGAGSRPSLPSGLDDAERAYLDVAEPVTWLAERLTGTPAGGDLADADLDALQARLALLGERTTSLPLVPHTVRLHDRLRAAGLEPLLADLAERAVGPDTVGAELDLVWWTSLLEHVALTDPAYGAHDGTLLRKVAVEFAEADRRHVVAGATRVRRITAERLVAALDEHGEQAALLRAEAARSRRHRPLRELVRSCPDVLAAAKPCWAMSPLVVSQVLPPGEQFDVVIFDEASQVLPADAVNCIYRGNQVIVAGDQKQLPPTSFFT